MSILKITSEQHTQLYNLLSPGYQDDLAKAQDMVLRIYNSFTPINPTHPSFMSMKKVAFLIGSLRFSEMSSDTRCQKIGECLNTLAALHDWKGEPLQFT